MHANRPGTPRPAPLAGPMRPDEVHRMLTPNNVTEVAPAIDAKRTGTRWSWLRFVRMVVIVLTAYVLSIGPLYWKWYGANSGVGSPIYKLIYWPLEELAYQFPTLGRLLNWYVSLWLY